MWLEHRPVDPLEPHPSCSHLHAYVIFTKRGLVIYYDIPIILSNISSDLHGININNQQTACPGLPRTMGELGRAPTWQSLQPSPASSYLGRAASRCFTRFTISLEAWCTSSSCICHRTLCGICSPSFSPKASFGRRRRWQRVERCN